MLEAFEVIICGKLDKCYNHIVPNMFFASFSFTGFYDFTCLITKLFIIYKIFQDLDWYINVFWNVLIIFISVNINFEVKLYVIKIRNQVRYYQFFFLVCGRRCLQGWAKRVFDSRTRRRWLFGCGSSRYTKPDGNYLVGYSYAKRARWKGTQDQRAYFCSPETFQF